MNTPLFYSFLFVHVISFIIAFGSVILIDVFGSLWLLKRVKLKLVDDVATVATRLIWAGLVGLIISGIVLIVHKGFIDNLTYIKLFFVAMLVCNGVFLYTIKKSTEPFIESEQVPAIIMFRTALASSISQLGWWGAIIIGFVHRHIEHYIPYPAYPWPWIIMSAIVILIGAAAITGNTLFIKKYNKNLTSNSLNTTETSA